MADKIIIFGSKTCKHTLSLTNTLQGASGLKLVLVDIYKRPEDALKYKVKAIPTTVLMQGVEEVGRVIGDLTVEQVKEWLERNLNGV